MLARYRVIGKRVPRVDAIEKVTGKAKYTGDITLKGLLFGKFVRSTFPHARIVKIDKNQAEKLPGVKAIITIDDAPRIPHKCIAYPCGENMPVDQYIFDEKVRFIGDGVAAVAAIDEDIAQEAVDLIKVEYEEISAAFDPEEAMKAGAPQVHHEENNLVLSGTPLEFESGNVEKGFEEADYIFEDRYETSRPVPGFLETYVCICSFDQTGKLTVWRSSQNPFADRELMSEVLDIPMNKVRVIMNHMGGGFGGKTDLYQHEFVCALLAKKAGRPVSMEYTMEETLMCGRTRHPIIIELKQGVKKDGTITAREAKVISNTGAYASHGHDVTYFAMTTLGSLYKSPNFRVEGYCVYTNTPIAGAHRGYGLPQAYFALESQMDTIAEKLGLDRLELRLKNRVGEGDPGICVAPITTCFLEECIKEGAKAIGWEKKTKRTRAGINGKKRRGVGMACLVFVSCSWPVLKERSSAFVKLNEDGTIHLMIGTADLGSGSKTTLAQIAAEELGVRFEDVQVTAGDTEVTPFDVGAFSSRTLYVAGGAVKAAAADIKQQVFGRAAETLEAAIEDLESGEGKIFVKGTPEKEVSISEIALQAARSFPAKVFLAGASFEPKQTYPFAAQFVEVEVDTETGKVELLEFVAAHDVGRAINMAIVEGQIEGAVHNGVGYALTEDIIVDKNTGNVLNPSFLDYQMPTALDMPGLEVIVVEEPDPTGPFGAKGLGEQALCPTAAAIANAVHDAVGVRIKDLPITPDKILKALQEKGLRGANP